MNQDLKDRLAQDLRAVLDDAQALAQGGAQSGDAQLDALRTRFADQMQRIRQQLDGLEDRTLAKAREAAKAADEAVHAHPYTAIGIAAAVGALVGLLVSRRR